LTGVFLSSDTLQIRQQYYHGGFILFDPSRTFGSVQANLSFLRQIIGDGSTAATFCRMLPYDGTAITADLERAGRLRGDICHPDYDFFDANDYFLKLAVTEALAVTRHVESVPLHGPDQPTNFVLFFFGVA